MFRVEHLVKGPDFRVAFVQSLFTYDVATLIGVILALLWGRQRLSGMQPGVRLPGFEFGGTTHPVFPGQKSPLKDAAPVSGHLWAN